MWTEDLYQKTINFAGEAHQDQKVPGSHRAYVVHLATVCMEVLSALVNAPDQTYEADFAMQCALLHDTLEDTAVTYPDLEREFGSKVAAGVLALTKDESIPGKKAQMIDSLNRIAAQPAEVRLVKMADRITNLQPPPGYWSVEKIRAYREEAQLILDRLQGVHPYLERRLAEKIDAYQQYLST
jgi:(p)ppGpp synthase/HD superfamily hydrolase